mmetsp:Transcript_58102/g.188065  ORF Transcript_58102/g.188065 Transcript_58102/m.188065 type:complete len:91 (-) Transcript_58102:472-744(-)
MARSTTRDAKWSSVSGSWPLPTTDVGKSRSRVSLDITLPREAARLSAAVGVLGGFSLMSDGSTTDREREAARNWCNAALQCPAVFPRGAS